ncbi:MAG: OmpA family protein [Chitinophagales bacterium]
MRKSLLIIFNITFAFSLVFSQEKETKQADAYVNQLAYAMAIPLYEQAIGVDSSRSTMLKLAKCYNKTNDYTKAEKWYKKAFVDMQLIWENGTEYADMLKTVGKYEELATFINDFQFKNEQDYYNINALHHLDKKKTEYIIEPVSFNSEESEFASFLFNNTMYVAKETNEDIYPWTGNGYLDLYTVNNHYFNYFESLEPINGNINTTYHEGAASLDIVNNTIYFTRNNFFKKRKIRDSEGVVNLKIYSSTINSGEWTKIEPFHYNSNEYSCGHPYVSPDGSKLFFVSDMPGGFGGTDIYVCRKENNGWGAAINLGEGVNTPFNEMFPVAYSNDEIYFSSEGHNSMGGLDIFIAQSIYSVWQPAQNMGSGINSYADDFLLLYANEEKNQGYFSSNRSDGVGGDDVYSFRQNVIEESVVLTPIEEDEETEESILIPYKVTVYDEETSYVLEGVNVVLYHLPNNTEIDRKVTDINGEVIFMVDPDEKYRAGILKDGYFDYNEDEINPDEEAILGLYKNELNRAIKIKNIYYDLDKAEIKPFAALELNKIAKILQDNPNVNIELSSHTDSRGSFEYNAELSKQRAQSAVQYILSKGIHYSRIVAAGYGEMYPVNRCIDGVECTEEEFQQNRRTEFKVTGYSDEDIISDADYQPVTNYTPPIVEEPIVEKVDIPVQPDNYYSVQIGAYSSQKTTQLNNFLQYGNLVEIPENNLYIYSVGQFSTKESAQLLAEKLKANGDVEKAFVIMVANGKRKLL